jgi:hypothetical protein
MCLAGNLRSRKKSVFIRPNRAIRVPLYSIRFLRSRKKSVFIRSSRVIRVPLYSSVCHCILCPFASLRENSLMYLTRKMKLNIRVIRPLRIQKPITLRQVDHMAVFIRTNIRLLKPGKFFQLLRVFRS